MNSYRVDYEERMDDGYIHLAHMELTAATGQQALNTAFDGLTDAGIHIVRIGPVQLRSPVGDWASYLGAATVR